MKKRTPVPTVYDARYCCEAAPLLSTTKQARVVAAARKLGLLDIRPTEMRTSAGILGDIERHHATNYVRAVRTGEPRSLAESQGFDWSPAFAESVAQIWHGHEQALGLLREHPLVLHPVSGAHHAHYARGGGFCTFNYLIGAATRYLSAALQEQCLIVDLDAHLGDGTLAFAELPGIAGRFTLFDIHGGSHTGPRSWAPHFLYEVQHAKHYLQVLRSQLPLVIQRVQPKFVQYLAGADPYEADYVGGIKGMTVEKLRERDRIVIETVRRFDIPMVVTLAGGYVPGLTEKIHVNTIRVMADALEGR